MCTMCGLKLRNPQFPAFRQFKSVYTALRAIYYFPHYNPLPHRHNGASLSLCRYFYGKCSDELYSSIPPVQTFTSLFPSSPAGKNDLPLGDFLPNNSYFMEHLPRRCFPNHYQFCNSTWMKTPHKFREHTYQSIPVILKRNKFP